MEVGWWIGVKCMSWCEMLSRLHLSRYRTDHDTSAAEILYAFVEQGMCACSNIRIQTAMPQRCSMQKVFFPLVSFLLLLNFRFGLGGSGHGNACEAKKDTKTISRAIHEAILIVCESRDTCTHQKPQERFGNRCNIAPWSFKGHGQEYGCKLRI